MVQLIGLLLCVYVFVRGLDIRSRVEDRKSGSSVALANAAAIIAIIAALIFAFLLIVQGNSMPSPSSPSF
jgi:uncharacterized membrane protein